MSGRDFVDVTAPLDPHEHDDERQARRIAAAMLIGGSLATTRALLAGRPVPRELLNRDIEPLLHVWGGFLDDAAVLDVEVAAERRRVGAVPPPPPPPGPRPTDFTRL